VRPALFASTRIDWHGMENLPTDRGFIAAANHMTEVDPVTVAHFLWDQGFAPRILAKDSLFRVPVLGHLLEQIGAIPVARATSSAAQSLDAAGEALAAGECVLVFPEGTLTRDPDLWPMVAKSGVARLALATGAPVVPISQWGSHLLLGPYGRVLHPVPRKRVSVVAGPAVDLSDLHGDGAPAAAARAATARIMTAVPAGLAELRGETPPVGFWDPRTSTRTTS
jgi:1-acyl-sn-glycerol-3-phosphate acyltransferase